MASRSTTTYHNTRQYKTRQDNTTHGNAVQYTRQHRTRHGTTIEDSWWYHQIAYTVDTHTTHNASHAVICTIAHVWNQETYNTYAGIPGPTDSAVSAHRGFDRTICRPTTLQNRINATQACDVECQKCLQLSTFVNLTGIYYPVHVW